MTGYLPDGYKTKMALLAAREIEMARRAASLREGYLEFSRALTDIEGHSELLLQLCQYASPSLGAELELPAIPDGSGRPADRRRRIGSILDQAIKIIAGQAAELEVWRVAAAQVDHELGRDLDSFGPEFAAVNKARGLNDHASRFPECNEAEAEVAFKAITSRTPVAPLGSRSNEQSFAAGVPTLADEFDKESEAGYGTDAATAFTEPTETRAERSARIKARRAPKV